ncbi:MAG: sodium/sugar symporter [Candidatus Marinimicrobia bacterium]|nr:sodium/sugar symporter [Candidatus Neomarinimicrobiota bacterium]
MEFSAVDYLTFIIYAVTIVSVGLWVSRSKEGHEKNAEDYFLAGKSLPWWAIGASLIAANISAEQFIGMSGSGFSLGLAIASYEWMAAITLLIVGKYFLPIFIEKNIYTIPGFVEVRYSKNLKTILAVFWIGLFIFVNLTSVLFLGAKALDTILGSGNGDYIIHGILGLAFFAAAYSIWGGLSAVAWTDVIQVILLIGGGLITTVIALNHVTPEGGVFVGLSHIYNTAGEHFHMILKEGHPSFNDLPGIAVLVGGMWVANLYYWGFNQYIIQRTFAAKSLKESQKGIAFAAFLKLIIPVIVVIPGIVAYVMFTAPEGTSMIPGVAEAFNTADGINYDKAYPWLISQFVPTGLKGLVLAALAAAIVSSLASMLNSTSTIFTMDIYRAYIKKDADDRQTVRVGRIAVLTALVIAVLVAPSLGSVKEMFQYIQEYTGLVSPGVLAVFMMGLFYKRSTNNAAIWGAISSIPIALVLKLGTPMPWMHQMMITWIATMLIIAVVSQIEGKGAADPKGIPISRKYFATEPVFNISATIIGLILVVVYAVYW